MEKNTPTVIKCSDHLATEQLEPKAAEDFLFEFVFPVIRRLEPTAGRRAK